MSEKTMIEAIRECLGQEMEADHRVVVIGEDFHRHDDLPAIVCGGGLVRHVLDDVESGTAKLARIAIMVITTRSSMRVKPRWSALFIVVRCLVWL